MGAVAGDHRANAHCMGLNKKGAARRVTSYVSAKEYSCAVSAWVVFVKDSCTMIYALVTFAPCQARSFSCSLNRRTYMLKVSSTLLPKDPVPPPPHYPLRF
jgi:hypothetical protein